MTGSGNRGRLVAMVGWWFWPAAVAAYFLAKEDELVRRHALWAMGVNLAGAVLFGFLPLVGLGIASALRNETLKSLAALGGFGWTGFGMLVWAGVAGWNTYLLYMGRAPWARPVREGGST